jgi:4-amino-4-deoxy-L-arabinose transferase-like glycosyltransferase
LAALVFVLYFRAQPHWLADPDAQDYAQAGRQLAAGRGPTTRFMPWNGLDYLVQRGAPAGDTSDAPSWPNIVRFPLTPLLMALSFLAFGPGDEAVHLPAGLAFVLTAGCAGLLGARVYGAWAGIVAGLTAAFLPLLVNFSLTGLTEPLLGLLILGVLVCAVRPHPPTPSPARRGGDGSEALPSPAHGGGVGGRGLLVLGGALFGLAVLNRYDTAILALPILALWLLPRPDRRRASALFLGPALVVVLPWAIYLTAVAGAPLFNLQPASIAAQASGRADGLGWYLPEYVSPSEAWSRDPARAFRIAREEIVATPDHLRKLLGWPWLILGGIACLFGFARSGLVMGSMSGAAVEQMEAEEVGRLGLGPDGVVNRKPAPTTGIHVRADSQHLSPTSLNPILPHRLSTSGASRIVLFLVIAVLLRASLASVLGLNLQRHFVPLVPLLLVIVAGEASWLVSLLPIRASRIVGNAAVALLLVVPGLWAIWPFLVPPTQTPGPPTRAGEVEARPENLARLAEVVGPSQVVASNVPWSVAWQADRHAVPLPPTVEATAELERRFGISVDAIYVAGQVAIADAPRSWRAWDDLRRRGAPPPGYVLADSFANGGRLFVKAR